MEMREYLTNIAAQLVHEVQPVLQIGYPRSKRNRCKNGLTGRPNTVLPLPAAADARR
jgi:hypothetical protein